MTTIAGFLVDMSNPETGDWTGSKALTAEQNQLPKGTLFYVGGNTPHVWTLAQMKRQSTRYRLPCWVYDSRYPGYSNGKMFGKKAANIAATYYGFPLHQEREICLDMETWEDYKFTLGFRDGCVSEGAWYTPYGSLANVLKNFQGAIGSLAALWDDDPNTIPDGCWGKQYEDAEALKRPYDMSSVKSWDHIWDYRGGPAPAPVQPPVSVPVLSGVLVTGSFDSPSVRTVKSQDDGKTWG